MTPKEIEHAKKVLAEKYPHIDYKFLVDCDNDVEKLPCLKLLSNLEKTLTTKNNPV